MQPAYKKKHPARHEPCSLSENPVGSPTAPLLLQFLVSTHLRKQAPGLPHEEQDQGGGVWQAASPHLSVPHSHTAWGVTPLSPPLSRLGDRGAEWFWNVLEASAVGVRAREPREGRGIGWWRPLGLETLVVQSEDASLLL